MNSLPPIRSHRAIGRAGLAVSIFLILTACASVESHQARVGETEAVGIPYHLPIGQVELSLTFTESDQNGQKTITPSVATNITAHPDPEAAFVLLPSHHAWFVTDHNISISNGLLTSVSTTESGEADAAVLSLVETGIGIAKLSTGFGSFIAESESADEAESTNPFLTESIEPSQAEISYIYRELVGRSVARTLVSRADNDVDAEYLPGTGALVYTTTSLDTVNFHPLDSAPGNARRVKADIAKDANAAGIYTRTKIPYTANLTLWLDTEKLRALRKRAFEQELKKLEPVLTKLDHQKERACEVLELRRKTVERVNEELDALRERHATIFEDRFDPAIPADLLAERKTQLTEIDEVITQTEAVLTSAREAERFQEDTLREIEAEETAAREKKERYTINAGRYAVTIPAGEKRTHLPIDCYPLHVAHAVVVLPDPNSVVRVPVTRAPVGDTTNTLQFENGLLTSYQSNHPSAAAEIAGIPASILNEVTSKLTEIFQFRVNLNSSRLNAKTSDVNTFESLIELNERLDAARERQRNGPADSTNDEDTPPVDQQPDDPGSEDSTTETDTQQVRDNEPIF